jgi:hypothetical protein
MSFLWFDSISDWNRPGEAKRFSRGRVQAIPERQPQPKMGRTMWIRDSVTLRDALRWLNERHRQFWSGR